jgi:hypothetical protein
MNAGADLDVGDRGERHAKPAIRALQQEFDLG